MPIIIILDIDILKKQGIGKEHGIAQLKGMQAMGLFRFFIPVSTSQYSFCHG
jgi:hypothetical protein